MAVSINRRLRWQMRIYALTIICYQCRMMHQLAIQPRTMFTTLISVADLHDHLHDPDFIIVDCRFELLINGGRDDAGRTAYRQGHIPGAAYAHLNEDLSGTVGEHTGRHPLPDPRLLANTFGRWGIGASKQVVAYDADTGAMAAARLWWLLRWLGHERVAVLNGGFKQWLAAGYEVTSVEHTVQPLQFKGVARASMVADAKEVALRAAQSDWRVLDARAPERFAGKTEPIDLIAGHVPGAVNFPMTLNLQSDGMWQPAATLRTQFVATLGRVNGAHTIAMCGSGVTACHNLLALEIAGIHAAKLYAGSWSEWITDASRPVARGD